MLFDGIYIVVKAYAVMRHNLTWLRKQVIAHGSLLGFEFFKCDKGGGGMGVTSAWSPLGNFIEGQAHPNVFAFLQFSLNQGLCIFCFAEFPSHVFFVFAFRWFRVFHRGCYVYFPIVFRSNSLYILYIFIYFLYIFFIVFCHTLHCFIGFSLASWRRTGCPKETIVI